MMGKHLTQKTVPAGSADWCSRSPPSGLYPLPAHVHTQTIHVVFFFWRPLQIQQWSLETQTCEIPVQTLMA